VPPADGDLRPLGQHLRELRQEQHLTIEGLATRAGLSSRAVSYIELGERDPSYRTLLAISRALGRPIVIGAYAHNSDVNGAQNP
jgi:transcriptional regulator with XRE-family HTH domain